MKMTCRLIGLVMAAGLLLARGAENAGKNGAQTALTKLLREATLTILQEGNTRYAAGRPLHPNQDVARRLSTAAEGQQPLATVLACSDSREPVELIFDRGLGELFVVRVAGNVADTDQLATIEYGVDHLETPLLLVVGHSRCGAVTAAVTGAELHGHLPQLVAKIKPAVEKAKAGGADGLTIIDESIRANVWQSVGDILRRSEIVRKRVQAGNLHVVGAVYDLDSGMVRWLGVHPEQEALLAQTAVDPITEPAPPSTGPLVQRPKLVEKPRELAHP